MSLEVIDTFPDFAARNVRSYAVPSVGKLVRVLDIGGGQARLYQIDRAGVGPSIFSDAQDGGGGLIESLATTELDTSKLLKPDGVGGVAWVTGAMVAMHDLGGGEHNPDTLANLNSKITDATLADSADVLLLDGTQAMTGDLDLGSQNIVSVGTINGVDPDAHGSRHTPGGADAVTTAAPTTGIGGGNTEGSAGSAARSDHDHKLRTTTGPTDLTIGAVADGQTLVRSGTTIIGATGVAPSAHAATHAPGSTDPIATGVPGQIDIGDTGIEGVAATLARSDHEHAFPAPAAPVNVTKDAAATGTATTPARADHKHDISTAAPTATGVATASAEGTATTLARSDHAHQSNTAPANVTKAAAAIGISGEPARADHKHDITTAAPVSIGTANAEGASTTLARATHVHDHGDQSTPTHHTRTSVSVGDGFQPQSHRSATTDPTVTDDSGGGWHVGSYWVNTTLDRVFVCVDSTVAAAVWLSVTANTVVTEDIIPIPVMNSTGSANRADALTLEGGMYTLDRPVLANRFCFRVTALAGAPTIAIGLYQAPGGGYGVANRIASVAAFAPGATGNFQATFDEGDVAIERGQLYVMQGRSSAAGSYSTRNYAGGTIELMNVSMDTVYPRPLMFGTTLLASALPATFDPRVTPTGQSAPTSTSVQLILRMRKV